MRSFDQSHRKEATMKEAIIKDVEIKKVNSIFRRKPKGLGFEDTDAVTITAESGSKTVSRTFYICLKPDGTFNPKAINKGSQAHRSRFVSFLKYYGFADDVKGYNIQQESRNWIGKKITVESFGDLNCIYIP